MKAMVFLYFSLKGADGGDSAKSICNQMSLYWQVEWWIDYPTYSHYFGIKKRHSHEILCDVTVQYECMYILFIDRFRWLRVYVPSFINLRPDLGNIFLYKFFTKILKIIWRRFIHLGNIMLIFFIFYGNNEKMHRMIYEENF